MSGLVGKRVRVDGPIGAPETGVGRSGVVLAVRECESAVTGLPLRWTEYDVRLDNGTLITRRPWQLRVSEDGS